MRVIKAGDPGSKWTKVWLNGKEVSNRTYWAWVPDGGYGFGLLKMYAEIKDGPLKTCINKNGELELVRIVRVGFVRWDMDYPEWVRLKEAYRTLTK